MSFSAPYRAIFLAAQRLPRKGRAAFSGQADWHGRRCAKSGTEISKEFLYPMKRLLVFAILPVWGFVLAAQAQAPAAVAPAGPERVAVIAFQAAVSQTNEFQRDFADLQKKYDPKRQELKTLSDEIDSLTKQLQAPGANLTDAERANRTQAIEERKRRLSRATEEAQSDFQSDMQQLFNQMAAKVGETMSTFAQLHGYTLVLDAGQQQSSVVLYAIPSTDITKAVIDAYNEKSGIPAPAAQPAAQPVVDAPMPAPSH
jgi:outer membrane protein